MSIKFVVSEADEGTKKVFAVKPETINGLTFFMGQWIQAWVIPEITSSAMRLFKTHPTGNLERSFFGNSKPTSTGAEGEVYSKNIYSRIQDEGGEIKPVRAKWLTIPQDAIKTKAGKTRASALIASENYAYTFFHRENSNKLILFGIKRTKKAEIVPLFLLVKRVKLPGTKYFTKALQNVGDFVDFLQEKMEDFI